MRLVAQERQTRSSVREVHAFYLVVWQVSWIGSGSCSAFGSVEADWPPTRYRAWLLAISFSDISLGFIPNGSFAIASTTTLNSRWRWVLESRSLWSVEDNRKETKMEACTGFEYRYENSVTARGWMYEWSLTKLHRCAHVSWWEFIFF